MGRRRRHATFAVLLSLFVLPVVLPAGVPGLEGWFDGAIHWTSRFGLSTPNAVDLTPSSADADGARARDLAVLTLEQRETHYAFVDEVNQRRELFDAVRSLDRLPLAKAARVLRASDASSLRRSILIDVGSADGMTEGLAVVQGGIFVGVIQRVDAHSSRVQLVTDPYSRLEVAVRTREGGRATAWLRSGVGNSPMSLRNLRASDGIHIRADDPVLTDNQDERVPAGLVVGRVVSASDVDADSIVDVRVRPMFDLVRTTSVLVLVQPR